MNTEMIRAKICARYEFVGLIKKREEELYGVPFVFLFLFFFFSLQLTGRTRLTSVTAAAASCCWDTRLRNRPTF